MQNFRAVLSPIGTTHVPDKTLRLPRTLVNQLLRQAQQAAGITQGFVFREGSGRYRCELVAANADLSVAARHAQARTPVALFRSSHAPLTPLAGEQMAAFSAHTALFLDIALDTKGVLQLRAWRLADNQATVLEINITEAAEIILA